MAAPQTRILGGTGSSVASYRLPPGVFQYIQSVLVEVDTGGSGDVQPTLEVATSDGVVMAAKQQGRAIAGGGSGRATWALRLDDEDDQSTLPIVGALMARDGAAVAQTIATDAFLGNNPVGLRHDVAVWASGVTVDLTTNPSRLVIIDAGLYLCVSQITWGGLAFPNNGVYTDAFRTTGTEYSGASSTRIIASKPTRLVSVGFARCAAGAVLIQRVAQDTGAPQTAPLGHLFVVRLGGNP